MFAVKLDGVAHDVALPKPSRPAVATEADHVSLVGMDPAMLTLVH